MRVRRFIKLSSSPTAAAEIRTAVFEEREHIVIPVVALVGGEVVHASNAPGPELVPSSVIERSAMEWNGRPIVGDHPIINGLPVSANDPPVYERFAFGRIANPRFENGRLLVEAWIDKQKAAKVGDDAVSVLTRAEAKEVIEVSVGAWVEVEESTGVTPDGKAYVGIWQDIGSDHLAMLPEGVLGACSAEMGCGAPRVNSGIVADGNSNSNSNVNTALNSNSNRNRRRLPVLRAATGGSGNMNILQRLFSRVRLAQDDDGISDRDLRDKLWNALHAVEPGFDWIVEVFPNSTTVIYTTIPENEFLWWRRTYTVAEESGQITLNEDRVQVEPVTRYEPVAEMTRAAESVESAPSTPPCQCQSKSSQTTESQSQPQLTEGGITAMTAQERTALIGRLIAAGRFKEDARGRLEKLEEDVLRELDAAAAATVETSVAEPVPSAAITTPAVTPPTAVAKDEEEDTAAAAATVEIPAEEYEALQSLAKREMARTKKAHAALVGKLKTAQKRFNEAALKAMSLSQLEDFAALLNLDVAEEPTLRDYSGRGLASTSIEDDTVPPPPSLRDAIMARRGGNTSSAAN